MTQEEAKDLISNSTMPPDDITINGKEWRVEETHRNRSDALGSMEYFSPGDARMFKYSNGYVIYRRYHKDPHGRW